ncbi:hypothetical protein MJI20_29720, partial [Salmonella enterica subsp. enterica serovar Anatum]|nr:hypothetical protein [Salmonella enterica subsp. enterica serovar Anatum]
GFLLEPQHNVMQMGGDFANNPNAQQFIDKMVSKHGFDRQQLHHPIHQLANQQKRAAHDFTHELLTTLEIDDPAMVARQMELVLE